jgi:hypothetical protein
MTKSIHRTFAIALMAIALPLHAQQQQAPAGLSSTAPAVELAKARLDGEVAATNAGGWFGRSVVIGALTGLIGTTITYAVAATSTPELPTEKKLLIADKPQDFQVMYEKGYADKVRKKRKSTALGGGLLGTAAFVALVVTSSGS